MLKIKLLTALIILTINNGICQNRTDGDKTEIHKGVVKALRKEGVKFNVFGFTDKSTFSNFDFSGGGRGLDTRSSRAWNKKEWIDFVKGIDTASIANYSLNINAHQSSAKKELIFAPIIFSKEKDKALCFTKLYSKIGGGQVTAWYYEKEKGTWILKDWQTFLLID